MKKNVWQMILFVVAFAAAYVLLCLEFPGGKMALEATPFDYVRVAVTYMAFRKTLVSLAVAAGLTKLVTIVRSKKK